jgi:uncharacterized membrane protein YeaQ/YmgE (transglycosylase-associated protein family)
MSAFVWLLVGVILGWVTSKVHSDARQTAQRKAHTKRR